MFQSAGVNGLLSRTAATERLAAQPCQRVPGIALGYYGMTFAMERSRYNINVNAIAPDAFRLETLDTMTECTGEFAHCFPRKPHGPLAVVGRGTSLSEVIID